MTQLEYDNIFDSFEEDPIESADLRFRSDLMVVLRKLIEARDWKQAEVMQHLDIAQPRASELMRGKIDKVSSEKLIGYLAILGFRFKPTYHAPPKRSNRSPIQCEVRSEAVAA